MIMSQTLSAVSTAGDDQKTPENIELLHTGEEMLRAESLKRIAVLPDMVMHLAMVEHSMDLINALLPSSSVQDEDQLMLGNLGIRIFNALAAALKLMLSGYYQASGLQLRDVLETAFLLDYFSTDSQLITAWRTTSEVERKRAFKPVNIRIALDNRDGFIEKKREEAYKLLCKLAGHATPEGIVMLVPQRGGKSVHCGPFLENSALQALLSEAAKLAVQAAGAFRVVIRNENLNQMEARIFFMEAEADWLEKFFAAKPDRTRIAEMRSQLAVAKLAKG